MNRKVAVLMGSDSDFGTMKLIIPVLQENDIDYDFRVISAHRTPEIAADFAKNAKVNGYDLIIAGAGMSAHLAGVLAAFTGVPVIGVPLKSDSSGMDGMDALHSIIQMPPGIPVAAVGIDNTEGAAKLAVKMINCCRKTDVTNSSGLIVKILYDRNEVSEANLDKAAKALILYGISYTNIDLAGLKRTGVSAEYDGLDPDEFTKELKLGNHDNTVAVLNLSNISIEKILENDENALNVPVIEVPLKAQTTNFNDTSNKVYYQTQSSKSVGFVGVNSYQNAAHMIARIIGIHNPAVYDRVVSEHAKLAAAVIEKDAKINNEVNMGKKSSQ